MNPLLYKAHPLLYLTVDLLASPAAHSFSEASRLAVFYLAVNVPWAVCFWWAVKKVAGFAASFFAVYPLALASLMCYLGPMLTLLADVLAHEFRFADRFILVFCLFVAVQILGAVYAVAIRQPRNGKAIGLAGGLSVALLMWLASIPFSLAVLGLNAVAKIPY